MFQLFEFTRDIRIDPADLGKDRVEAVTDEINSKFANRVVLGVGLCMSLWDIMEIKQGVIYPGDGGVHCQVKFRYIVFRPFQDEVIVGSIKRCTSDGIHVTLGFFDDIFIPQERLQHPSKFDERQQSWAWEYKEGEDDEIVEMYMEKDEKIRFKVTAEHFTDTTPVPQPPVLEGSSVGAEQGVVEDESSKIPYSLTAAINEAGLGLLSWWG